jgi:hypothetical protein
MRLRSSGPAEQTLNLDQFSGLLNGRQDVEGRIAAVG